MRVRTLIAVAAALTFAVGAVTAEAGRIKSKVRGKLTSDTSGVRTKARFKITSIEKNGTLKEKIQLLVKKLDVEKDDNGDRPTYDVILLDADETEYDFGELRLRRGGIGTFRWTSRRDDYPDGLDDLTDLGGGTFEVRDASDDSVVVSGDIPEFAGLDDDNVDGARTRGVDRNRLRPDDDTSVARGIVRAVSANRPGGDFDRISVAVSGLARGGGPYAVVIVDGDTEIDLGDIRTRGRRGVGKLDLDSDDPDFPDDDVLDLAGLDVEVRADDDSVVLSGTFPTIVEDEE